MAGALGVLALAGPARAEEVRELRHDLRVDVPVTVGGAALLVGLHLLQDEFAAGDCRWCDRDEHGRDSLNALDRGAREALRWSDKHAAESWSSISFLATPVAVAGADAGAALADGAGKGAPLDVLLVAEATVVAALLQVAVSNLVARRRPEIRALAPAVRARRRPVPPEDIGSFYAGHASFAFALATAGGTIASMRGYRGAPAVWAGGLGLATATSYLRVASDAHYLTDTLAGMVIGGAVGFAVPYLFHRPDAAARPGAPGPVTASMRW